MVLYLKIGTKTGTNYRLIIKVKNVILVKSGKLNYYIKITENEVEFSSKRKIHNYETSDFIDYRIVRKCYFYKEYELLLTDNRSIIIITRKELELKRILDLLISKRAM